MNPIIEKVDRRKPRPVECLVEHVGLIMAASAIAAEDFFEANPDGVFHDHSKYARSIIRATLQHYAENVSREMSAAGKIPTREIPLGNGTTTLGFGMGGNQDWLFQKMIKQALAELDA